MFIYKWIINTTSELVKKNIYTGQGHLRPCLTPDVLEETFHKIHRKYDSPILRACPDKIHRIHRMAKSS